MINNGYMTNILKYIVIVVKEVLVKCLLANIHFVKENGSINSVLMKKYQKINNGSVQTVEN
jgi:hypothetical protein